MEEVYRVRIRGVRPLLMANPEHSIGNTPKLRRGEHLDPKVEAEQYLYKDEKGNICVPARVVKACIRNAGRNYRIRGRRATFAAMISAGLEVRPENILLGSNWEVDVRSVVVQGQRIPRARPRFNSWALEFEIVNRDPTIIQREMLQRILADAGRYYGIGDYRPEFGLFEVEKFEVVPSGS
jgi:hypothetical protein